MGLNSSLRFQVTAVRCVKLNTALTHDAVRWSQRRDPHDSEVIASEKISQETLAGVKLRCWIIFIYLYLYLNVHYPLLALIVTG